MTISRTIALGAFLAPLSFLHAQTTPAPKISATPSSFATVEVHISARRGRTPPAEWWASEAGLAGPSRIAIAYGQPHARGRQVVGGLIPKDTVWRFGANEATTLHTDVDLKLGDLSVRHGDYTLFLLHSAKGWELIVNTETAQWGLDYDPSRDVGRIPLDVRQLSEPRESLSIFLASDAKAPSTERADLAGALRITWGTVELSTRWAVVEK